jgi:2-phosphoglycerate kinase
MSDLKEDRTTEEKTLRIYAMGVIAEALAAAGIEHPTARVMASDAVASVEAHGIRFVKRGE